MRDENNRDHLEVDTAEAELLWLINEEGLRDLPLLILANKQDLSQALSAEELTQRLSLSDIPSSRPWRLQLCSVAQGTGLYEGLDWLAEVADTSPRL